jgi:hypothetical protein
MLSDIANRLTELGYVVVFSAAGVIARNHDKKAILASADNDKLSVYISGIGAAEDVWKAIDMAGLDIDELKAVI